MASELCFNPGKEQISMLSYTLGDECEDLHRTFKFPVEANLQYKEVIQRFDHFLK